MFLLKKYELLTAPTPEKLNEQVNALLNEGWQPHGSPSMFHITPSASPVHMVYLQAMVK